MTLLSKADILNSDDLTTETIAVPEWGGEVRISAMTAFNRDAFEASIIGKNGGQNLTNIRAKLAAATLVNEQGQILFTEKEVLKLGNKSAAALDRIFEAAQRINGMTTDDVEELAKN